MHILGVGEPFVDLTSHVTNEFLEELKVKPGTRFVVDESTFVSHVKRLRPAICRTGGSTANTVISMACMGLSTAFIGCVGNDEYGRFFRAWIKELGVTDYCAAAADGLVTSRCLNLVTPDAERTMGVFVQASHHIEPRSAKEEYVAASDYVISELYQLYSENNRKILYRLIDLAECRGKKIAIGISDVFCVKSFREEVMKLVDRANILFGNEYEWMEYYQTSDCRMAAEAALRYCQAREDCVIAITRGEKGALLAASGESELIHIDAVKVKGKETNLTGAGDSFAAGFLYAMIRGASLRICGMLGARVASQVISKERATLLPPEGYRLAQEFNELAAVGEATE